MKPTGKGRDYNRNARKSNSSGDLGSGSGRGKFLKVKTCLPQFSAKTCLMVNS